MRKLFVRLFTLCVLFSQTTGAFAASEHYSEETNSFRCCGKIYVAPEQVAMSAEGIFVKFEDKWFQTESLFSDHRGVFVQNLRSSDDGCSSPYIVCRNCKRCVHEIFDICPYCRKPT